MSSDSDYDTIYSGREDSGTLLPIGEILGWDTIALSPPSLALLLTITPHLLLQVKNVFQFQFAIFRSIMGSLSQFVF